MPAQPLPELLLQLPGQLGCAGELTTPGPTGPRRGGGNPLRPSKLPGSLSLQLAAGGPQPAPSHRLIDERL